MRNRANLRRAAVWAIFVVCICITLPGVAHAATHWVSPAGTAAWGSCIGSATLTGTGACSLATANANGAAGDLVYLRGGIYNLGGGVGIRPAHSGTSATNMITFQAYTGETPTLSNGTDPFWLSGNSYISIKGLTFGDPFSTTWGRIDNGGNHNEIAQCTFTTTSGGGLSMLITGASNQNWATHNWIHDNHFVVSGQANGADGPRETD